MMLTRKPVNTLPESITDFVAVIRNQEVKEAMEKKREKK